jgi:molybdopterin-guanine dinucleotide biosynthesis protein A
MLLAAGRGERMRPLTDTCPKPLLKVQGKPLMQWHLDALQRDGAGAVLVNTAWLGEQIEATFGPALQYSHEGRDFGGALETAGGIVRALPHLHDVFWVLAGDVFAPDFVFSADAVRAFEADTALAHTFAPKPVTIDWRPGEEHPFHPNGLRLSALDAAGGVLGEWLVFSVGGGALREPGEAEPPAVYPYASMAEVLATGQPLHQLVRDCEGDGLWDHLAACWQVMRTCLGRGLAAEGELPGGLRLQRRARAMMARSRGVRAVAVSAFALAVM